MEICRTFLRCEYVILHAGHNLASLKIFISSAPPPRRNSAATLLRTAIATTQPPPPRRNPSTHRHHHAPPSPRRNFSVHFTRNSATSSTRRHHHDATFRTPPPPRSNLPHTATATISTQPLNAPPPPRRTHVTELTPPQLLRAPRHTHHHQNATHRFRHRPLCTAVN